MRDEQEQQNNQDNQSEYLKFVGVLALFLAVILCIVLLVPPLFSNAIPAALGLNGNSADNSEATPPQYNSGEELQTEKEPADSEVTTPQAVSALNVHAGEDILVAQESLEFARKVLSLIKDPEYRRDVGQAGRRYVEEYHRWTNIAQQLEGIYHEVIGTRL